MSKLINTNQALQQLVDQLSMYQAIGLDTEFYWRRTYYPQLCLIQIATVDHIYLVDPCADGMNLSLLNAIFSDTRIVKIMHAADNDIKILHHVTGGHFHHVFDTQIALAFLGGPSQISLANLLKQLSITTFEKDKQDKLSDWRQRPLTNAQVEYAARDVRYLHQAYEQLSNQLKAHGHTRLFNQEMMTLAQNSHFNGANITIVPPYTLPKHAHCTFTHLTRWREKTAQQADVPVKYIMTNQHLIALSKKPPQDLAELESLNLLAEKSIQRYGTAIIEQLDFAKKTAHPKQSKRQRGLTSAQQNDLMDYLKQLCQQKQFDPGFIGTKHDINAFVKHIRNPSETPVNKLNSGWRYELFGRYLEAYYHYQLH